MLTLFQWLVFLMYAAAGVFYIRDFAYQKPGDRKTAAVLFPASLVVHFGLLVYLMIVLKRIPVATLGESIGTFVWITGLIYWFLEWRLRERSMGIFILPILLLLIFISNRTFRIDEPINEVLKDVQFEIHVFFMLLSYGAFVISFIASLMHLLLNREIQKRNMGVFYRRLPSLAFFEQISNAAVDIGLVFISIGFLLGLHNALKVWDPSKLLDMKIIAVLLTWLIYLSHFLSRKFAGWQGQRAASLSVVGFGWLMFSFLIINLFFHSIHHFI
ncbi:MAG: hypothetical protein D6814_17455 [Calditrichaeota bacterium]|nr:MAG: hypothetical protein D6814_17455 [Calditrichota bacterium]